MTTDQSLHGRVAVVTGAGRGIGRSAAVALAAAGADVALASRSTDQLEAAADEVRGRGRRALAVPTDITDEAAVEALASRVVSEFGRVDVLVNNSGVLATTPLLEQTAEEWDTVHATNVRGTFLATRAIGRHLVDQGSGKVINIASNFAFNGVPLHTAYCSSKAAVVALTRSLSVEWARYGVQVNAIAPGYFATDLNAEARADPDTYERMLRSVPARRMGGPEELNPWLVLMAGPGSDFMTGETVVIDGGQSAR